MLMPVIRIRDNISLPELGMRIKVYDEIVFEREYDEIAENAYEKIIDQTTAVCEAHYARILNKQLVKVLVENVREQYPGAADDLIPGENLLLSGFKTPQICRHTAGADT